MSTPDQQIDFSDFTAEVADRTGSTPEQLTDRSDGTVSRDSDLLARARAERAPDGSSEIIAEVLWQYDTERKRVLGWVGSSPDMDSETYELIYGGERLAPMPTFEQIHDALHANPEVYARKIEQGFTKLLIVPFGARITTLLDAYQQDVTIASEGGALLDSDGTPIDEEAMPAVTEDPALYVNADTHKRVCYSPEGIPNRARTKEEEIVNQAVSGWQVLLVEDVSAPGLENADIRNKVAFFEDGFGPLVMMQARDGVSDAALGRGDLEHEVGLTLESYLALAHQYLCEERKLLDLRSTTLLLGMYEKAEKMIPIVSRDSASRVLQIDELSTVVSATGAATTYEGVRTAVLVDMLPEHGDEPGGSDG